MRIPFVVLFGIFIVLVFIGNAQFAPLPDPPPLPQGYRGDRAVWMGVNWSMAATDDATMAALADDLTRRGIDYAFVYVSYLRADGTFNPTYAYAAEFVSRLRLSAPDITLLAWIGVPLQLAGDESPNRLTDATVRQTIATFAARTVTDLGFDGVHLNAERIPDNDPAFIQTLRAIRAALPDGAFLSTTAHALRLTEPVTAMPYPTVDHHWSSDYLRTVAREVDQAVLMAYDSGLFLPTDYRSWLRYQVQTSMTALEGVAVHFLVGLPTSEEWTWTHHVSAETLENAVYAVRQALAAGSDPSVVDGIAVYPYWETSINEWQTLRQLP